METSASFEARSAPSSYPTRDAWKMFGGNPAAPDSVRTTSLRDSSRFILSASARIYSWRIDRIGSILVAVCAGTKLASRATIISRTDTPRMV